MTSEDIKSSLQVISEFLDSLQGDPDIDAGTLAAARELFKAATLSRTRLLSSLAALRTDAVALPSVATPDVDEHRND